MHLLQNCSDLTNPSVGHRVEESEQSESPGPRAESDVRLEVRKEARLFMRWDSVTAGAESGHVFELRDWDTRKLLCSRIPQSENSYIPCSRSSSVFFSVESAIPLLYFIIMAPWSSRV